MSSVQCSSPCHSWQQAVVGNKLRLSGVACGGLKAARSSKVGQDSVPHTRPLTLKVNTVWKIYTAGLSHASQRAVFIITYGYFTLFSQQIVVLCRIFGQTQLQDVILLLSIPRVEQELVVIDSLCVGCLLSQISLIFLAAVVSRKN